jgi:membrane protease YdiL (CAAX protease family)
VASVATLWLLGRLDALRTMPAEFAVLWPTRTAPARVTGSSDEQLGMLVGALLSTGVAVLVWTRRVKTALTPVVPEVMPLIPRNAAERWAALPLCLNAGYAEELFFRLALPLLVTSVTGSVVVGTVVAVVVFGLVHWYQGWKGVVGTMLVGGLMTLVYVTSGSLVRVMVTHALIDVIGLIVRPMIGDRVTRRTSASAPGHDAAPTLAPRSPAPPHRSPLPPAHPPASR